MPKILAGVEIFFKFVFSSIEFKDPDVDGEFESKTVVKKLGMEVEFTLTETPDDGEPGVVAAFNKRERCTRCTIVIYI